MRVGFVSQVGRLDPPTAAHGSIYAFTSVVLRRCSSLRSGYATDQTYAQFDGCLRRESTVRVGDGTTVVLRLGNSWAG
jgi:hypothetical protein